MAGGVLLESPRHTASPYSEYRPNSDANAGLRASLLVKVESYEDLGRAPLPSPPRLAPVRRDPLLSTKAVQVRLSPVMQSAAASAAGAAAGVLQVESAFLKRPETPALIREARTKLQRQKDTWLSKGNESPFRPDRTYLKIKSVYGRCVTIAFRHDQRKGFIFKRTDTFDGSFNIILTEKVSQEVLRKNRLFISTLYDKAFEILKRKLEHANSPNHSLPMAYCM